jgi:hypothetical protein
VEWLLINTLQSTKDAAKFYTAKVDELQTNLKDLESIVQGKSNNLRVVEDGKQSRNSESQTRLICFSQFYDRRFSVATLVHQPQNKITYLLVDLCLIVLLSSVSHIVKMSTCPCLTAIYHCWINYICNTMWFPTSPSTYNLPNLSTNCRMQPHSGKIEPSQQQREMHETLHACQPLGRQLQMKMSSVTEAEETVPEDQIPASSVHRFHLHLVPCGHPNSSSTWRLHSNQQCRSKFLWRVEFAPHRECP